MKKAADLVFERVQSHLVGDDSLTSTQVGICTKILEMVLFEAATQFKKAEMCMYEDFYSDVQQKYFQQDSLALSKVVTFNYWNFIIEQ